MSSRRFVVSLGGGGSSKDQSAPQKSPRAFQQNGFFSSGRDGVPAAQQQPPPSRTSAASASSASRSATSSSRAAASSSGMGAREMGQAEFFNPSNGYGPSSGPAYEGFHASSAQAVSASAASSPSLAEDSRRPLGDIRVRVGVSDAPAEASNTTGGRGPRRSGILSSDSDERRSFEEEEEAEEEEDESVVVKIGVVGDTQTGKTSLVVGYVDSQVTDDYVQTLGVNCTEKSYALPHSQTQLTLSIWDMAGHRQFMTMLPLVCNDAAAILFLFDLTRRSTLHSVKQWYLQARSCNKTALPVLVGTKFDLFIDLPEEQQRIITKQARSFAQAMKAPLVLTSIPQHVHVHKVFKLVLAKLFSLPCPIPPISAAGHPIIEY